MKNVTMLLLTTLSRHKSSSYSNTETLSGTPFSYCSRTEIYMPPREKFAARVGLLLQKMTIYIFCTVAFVRSHTLQKYVMLQRRRQSSPASQPCQQRAAVPLYSLQKYKEMPLSGLLVLGAHSLAYFAASILLSQLLS